MPRPFFSFRLKNRKDVSLVEQLAEQVLQAIAQGACLQSSSQVISLREMKQICGCSLETVKKAYDLLVLQGWLTSIHGKGYFLTEQVKQLSISTWEQSLISLTDSTPAPTADFIRHLRQAFSDSFDSLGSSKEETSERRQRVKDIIIRHEKQRGITLLSKSLFFFNRSVSGFHFLLQYLTKPQEAIMVEEYTYPPFLKIMKHYQLHVNSAPLDQEGICLQKLQQAYDQSPFRWMMIQPHHHFPTGLSYSRKRKQDLLEWSAEHNVSIIENDHHGDLWFHKPRRTLYQLAASMENPPAIYYIHSFSKTLARELQLGLVAFPPACSNSLNEISQEFVLAGSEPSLLVLEAAARLVEDPWLRETYLPEKRAQYAHHWQILQQASKQVLPTSATLHPIRGGLNSWISWGEPTIRASHQEEKLVLLLQEEGLALSPGYLFRQANEHEVLRRSAVRFPLSPWGPREIQYWIGRVGAALLRI